MALVMIYLCSPLYRQITEGIHHLNHFIEKVYDFQSSTARQDVQPAHSYYNHKQRQIVHQHNTLDLFYKLFEVSNEKDHEEEGIPYKFKIDKHPVTEAYHIPPDNESTIPRKFDIPENRLAPGYINKLLHPPRSPFGSSVIRGSSFTGSSEKGICYAVKPGNLISG